MPRGGLRNPPGGRPLGSKNRIPKSKEAVERLREIVTELENGEYLYSNDKKEFPGTAVELLQAIYRCEKLPLKYRMYAATKAADIEPRPAAALPTAPDLDENRRWISTQFDKLAKAEAIEHERKAEHSADTALSLRLEHGRNARENGASAPDYKSVEAPKPQPQPAHNGHAQVQRVQRLYSHPSQEYPTLAGKTYQADNGGELVVDEDDVEELRTRLGAWDRR